MVNEILSIIGSFAGWEAANIWISEKPQIHLRKLQLKMLESTVFKYTVEEEKK